MSLRTGDETLHLMFEILLLKLQHLFLLQRDANVDRKIQDLVVTEGGIICQLPQKTREEDF